MKSLCRFSSVLAAAVALVTTGIADRASAATVTLNPLHDTAIYQDNVNNASGAGGLFAGANASAKMRRALLQFDLSAIPVGSSITGVSLDLVVIQASTTTATTFTLHMINNDWGEGSSNSANANGSGGGSGTLASAGEATWNANFYGTSLWPGAGGNFDPVVNAATTVTGLGTYTWSSAQMVNDVQAWIDGAFGNYGWLLDGGAGIGTARKFGARESLAASRPVLTVQYTAPAPVPVPAAVWLFGSGLLGVVGIARRRGK